MQIRIVDDYASLSQAAAAEIAAQLRAKPGTVLGLPTGNTPIGMYQQAAAMGLDFSQAATFNLDEYLGLTQSHPESYHSFMLKHLWSKINLPVEGRNIPNCEAPDAEAECARYEAALTAAGGMDLLFLGLGTNGHIAFNEPGTPWDRRTHVTDLAESTLVANAAPFGGPENVPKQALTMGIGTIMEARRIVVLASGKAKAPVLKAIFEGPATPDVPATILQNHPDVTFIVDRDAASLLQQA